MKSIILLISITLSIATAEHNYHVVFSEERVDSDGETYKSYSEQMILIPTEVSNNDKVNFIYNLFDNFPKNNYLTYNEIDILQNLTNPELPLDRQSYIFVCNVLGSNIKLGITLQEFNSSYYIFRDKLGTDLDRDYYKLLKLGAVI
jgi:hypothetical protein